MLASVNSVEALKTSGDAGDTGDTGESRWMLWRRATPCGQACYLWSLPLRQKWTIPLCIYSTTL